MPGTMKQPNQRKSEQRGFGLLVVTLLLGSALGFSLAVMLGSGEAPEEQAASVSERDASARRAETEASRSNARLSDRIAQLEAELREARSAQRAMGQELEELRSILEAESGEASLRTAPDLAQADPPPRPVRPKDLPKGAPWFDRSALEAAGLSGSEISEIEERFERYEMEKLYFVDESKREGTYRSAAYNRELNALTATLREDLGPDGYDAYLYATGRDNRVLIRDVLENSPAELAGVENGDLVLSYAGERMFHPASFQSATSGGDFGQNVELAVERGGEVVFLTVPRGPLGVRITRTKSPPTPAR